MPFRNENAQKQYKRMITGGSIGIIILLYVVVSLVIGLFDAKKKLENADSFYNVMTSAEERTGRVAYIDLSFEPVQFAEKKKDGYYFVFDEQEYMYAVKMKEKYADTITNEFNEKGSARLYGVSGELTDPDVKMLAVSALNELYPDEDITSADLENAVGDLKFNVAKPTAWNIHNEDVTWNDLICLFLFVFSLIFLLNWGYVLCVKLSLKQLRDTEELDREMDSPDAEWLPFLRMYATENYLIAFWRGLTVVPYDRILMMYKHVHSTNGFKDEEALYILNKSGKNIPVSGSFVTGLHKRVSEGIEREIETVCRKASYKNESIFFGYDAQVMQNLMKRAKSGEFEKTGESNEI